MKEEDLSAIKRYSIVEYLERKGTKPVRKTPTYAMYCSPLREKTHPSFKVDTEKNLWIDYAEGRGGSIIDLYMRLEDCSLSEAICRLGQNTLGEYSAQLQLSKERNIHRPKSKRACNGKRYKETDMPIRHLATAFAGVGYFGTLFCLVSFDSELGLAHSVSLQIYLCIGVFLLLIAAIVGIFRYDKGVWLRRNPNHSRLFLPSWNEGSKNMGVSISRVDDINYGRGVSFSWFDGRFITAGRHSVAFEYYEYKFMAHRSIRKIIYKKEMSFNFKAGAVYVIKIIPERQTFQITQDTTVNFGL